MHRRGQVRVGLADVAMSEVVTHIGEAHTWCLHQPGAGLSPQVVKPKASDTSTPARESPGRLKGLDAFADLVPERMRVTGKIDVRLKLRAVRCAVLSMSSTAASLGVMTTPRGIPVLVTVAGHPLSVRNLEQSSGFVHGARGARGALGRQRPTQRNRGGNGRWRMAGPAA